MGWDGTVRREGSPAKSCFLRRIRTHSSACRVQILILTARIGLSYVRILSAVAILGTSLFSGIADDDFGRFNRSFITVRMLQAAELRGNT